MFFIVLSCLLVMFHSTDGLWLSGNSLTGTIPSQVGLLTTLSESIVVLLLVVMIVLSCVFFIVLSCLLVIFHSTDELSLYDNNFTGEFTCPVFIDYCRISCDEYNNDTCRSL